MDISILLRLANIGTVHVLRAWRNQTRSGNPGDKPSTKKVMSIKAALARMVARQIEARTRQQRRSLRDYQRQEFASIHSQEIRSRGLRLYAAWSTNQPSNVLRAADSNWNPSLAQAA